MAFFEGTVQWIMEDGQFFPKKLAFSCDRILLDSYGTTSYLRMARSVMVEGVAAAVVVVLVLIVVVGDEVELEASVYKKNVVPEN